MSKPPRISAEGKWVLLDTTQEGMSLLSVGNEDFAGVSPRNTLDEPTRFILLKKMREAIDGTDFHGVVNFSGKDYSVTAVGIAPDDEQIVGALGIFAPTGQPLPEPPTFGSWRWRVNKTTGETYGENGNGWSHGPMHSMFRVYGTNPDMLNSPNGPTSIAEWLAKFVAPQDRNVLKLLIDNGIELDNRERQLVRSEIVFAYGTGNERTQEVSISARGYDDLRYPEAVMIRGITRHVDTRAKIVTPGLNPLEVGLIPEAIFALNPGTAFVGVDLIQRSVFQLSPSWNELGLQTAFEKNIVDLAHEEDQKVLDQYLATIASGKEPSASSISVRFKAGAEWSAFSVLAARIDSTETPSRYLMISLAPGN